mmetsp:Transcript_22982/g.64138  ORF Transcript_22982/g.64138 Transcript_22982/m.64138 type:complete len:380 (+) Transcript_22982:59-1198(+)
MAVPDLMETVGFKPGKVGPGEKELGYSIEKSRLGKVMLAVIAALVLLGLLLVWTQFEIHLEKRSLKKKMRHEEHHAATKLAKVEMELWSHFHDDIHESQEARAILRVLNASYEDFRVKLQNTINNEAKEFSISPEKASHMADKVLHLLAEHKQMTLKHTKSLVDHIVLQGTQSAKAEKKLDKEVSKEMDDEEGYMKDAGDDEEFPPGENGEADEEELKVIIGAFWETYAAFQKQFGTGSNVTVKEDSAAYKHLQDLQQLFSSDQPPSDEEVHSTLQTMDLATSIGQDFVEDPNDFFMRSPQDYVETILAIPRLPTKELAELETQWKAKSLDAYTILNHLHDWEGEGKIPTSWIERGVEREEYDEEEDGAAGGEHEMPAV